METFNFNENDLRIAEDLIPILDRVKWREITDKNIHTQLEEHGFLDNICEGREFDFIFCNNTYLVITKDKRFYTEENWSDVDIEDDLFF